MSKAYFDGFDTFDRWGVEYSWGFRGADGAVCCARFQNYKHCARDQAEARQDILCKRKDLIENLPEAIAQSSWATPKHG